VAGFVSRRLEIDVKATEVVLVPGTKNVVWFTLLACLEPGGEVILPDPGYPAYASLVNFVGGVPVPVRLREESNFRIDLEELAALITPAYQDADREYAPEPDRWGSDAGRRGVHRPPPGRARPDSYLGRDLLSDHVRLQSRSP